MSRKGKNKKNLKCVTSGADSEGEGGGEGGGGGGVLTVCSGPSVLIRRVSAVI